MVLVQSGPLPHPSVGVMEGRTPLGCCSSRWSASYFSLLSWTSYYSNDAETGYDRIRSESGWMSGEA